MAKALVGRQPGRVYVNSALSKSAFAFARDAEWQRRLVQPAFHRERIATYGDVMVSFAERLLSTWGPPGARPAGLLSGIALLGEPARRGSGRGRATPVPWFRITCHDASRPRPMPLAEECREAAARVPSLDATKGMVR